MFAAILAATAWILIVVPDWGVREKEGSSEAERATTALAPPSTTFEIREHSAGREAAREGSREESAVCPEVPPGHEAAEAPEDAAVGLLIKRLSNDLVQGQIDSRKLVELATGLLDVVVDHDWEAIDGSFILPFEEIEGIDEGWLRIHPTSASGRTMYAFELCGEAPDDLQALSAHNRSELKLAFILDETSIAVCTALIEHQVHHTDTAFHALVGTAPLRIGGGFRSTSTEATWKPIDLKVDYGVTGEPTWTSTLGTTEPRAHGDLVANVAAQELELRLRSIGR